MNEHFEEYIQIRKKKQLQERRRQTHTQTDSRTQSDTDGHGSTQTEERQKRDKTDRGQKQSLGGNQLLDGSVSLSRSYPSTTNDCHVTIATSLHQSFLLTLPCRSIVHKHSGPNTCALSLSTLKITGGCRCTYPNIHFLCAFTSNTRKLAHVLDSSEEHTSKDWHGQAQTVADRRRQTQKHNM